MAKLEITKEFIRDVMKGVLKYLREQGFQQRAPGYGTGSVDEKFYFVTDELQTRDPSKSRWSGGGIGCYGLMVRQNGTLATSGFEVRVVDDEFSVGGHTTGGRKLRLTVDKAVALGVAHATAAVKTKVGKKLDELTAYCAEQDTSRGADKIARKAIAAKFPGWKIGYGPYGFLDRMYRLRKDAARGEKTPAGVDEVVLEVAVEFADAEKSEVSDIKVKNVDVKSSDGLTRAAMDAVLAEVTF